jgi:toxin ParE1/3/4
VSRDLVWSHAARHDYLAVLRFIARENPGAASKVADRIDAAAASLGEFATGRAGRVSDTYEKVVSMVFRISWRTRLSFSRTAERLSRYFM